MALRALPKRVRKKRDADIPLLPDDDATDYAAALAPLGVSREQGEVAWLLSWGFDNDDMAVVLKMSESGVRKRLARLLRRVRNGIPDARITKREHGITLMRLIVNAYRRRAESGEWMGEVAERVRQSGALRCATRSSE